MARHGLHCGKMQFVHPITGECLEFEVPPPDDMQAVIKEI